MLAEQRAKLNEFLRCFWSDQPSLGDMSGAKVKLPTSHSFLSYFPTCFPSSPWGLVRTLSTKDGEMNETQLSLLVRCYFLGEY